MRRLVLAAAVAFLPTSALAGRTTVVLVGTTSTAMPKAIGRQAMLLENRGPNPIYCSFDPGVTVTTGHVVSANGPPFPFNGADQWYCIAGTAQVTGGGTVVSEV